MKRLEAVLCLAIWIIFSALFLRATHITYFTQGLDSAYFLESVDTTFKTGTPGTMLTRSVIHALKDLISRPASYACGYPVSNDGTAYMNIWERHAFPVLYPLAALRYFTNNLTIFELCAVAAFPGLLLIVYILSRRMGIPAWLAAVLVGLTASHPAWSYAAYGQLYPDKLFPPLCLIYLYLVYGWLAGQRRRPVLLLIAGTLAASTSERSAIMLCAATAAAIVFYSFRRRWTRSDAVLVCIPVLLAGYVLCYMRFVQTNPDYASFAGGSRLFLHSLTVPGDAARIYKFVSTNLLLLLPFGTGAIRWLIIGVFSLFPNLLGSIGGAEKLGWSTHYHSAYFPFLIFASIVGASALYAKSRALAAVGAAAGVVAGGVFLLLNPFTPRPLFDLQAAQFRQTGLVRTIELNTNSGPSAGIIVRSEYLRRVAQSVPEGAEVSTTEGYMPALYAAGIHLLHFYPLGLGAAEYVVLPYVRTSPGELTFSGYVSYLGPEVSRQGDACFQETLRANYEAVKFLANSASTGTAIFKRTTSPRVGWQLPLAQFMAQPRYRWSSSPNASDPLK